MSAADNHFRVVHYYTQFPLGHARRIVREHLDFNTARQVAHQSEFNLTHNLVVIEDENSDEEIILD